MNRQLKYMGAILVAVALTSMSSPLDAAKPGGGPPPAIGKIYYYYGSQPYSMNGIGGSKTLLTPATAPGSRPSRLRYSGGRRWSLSVGQTGTYDRVVNADGSVRSTNAPHYDLFASRPSGSGTQVVQVTDLFGAVRIEPILDSNKDGFVVWSNDGQDSFMSCKGKDLTTAFRVASDGATEIVFDELQDAIVALPVSGSELDSASTAGTWTPIDPLDPWEIVVSSSSLYENNFKHTWSPDGTMVAYVLAAPDGSAGEDMYVTDVASGVTQRIFDAGGNAPWVNSLQWQPGGNQLVFSYNGNVWLANAFAAGGQIAITGSDVPGWSPDGKHLVFRTTVRKGTRNEYQLSRHDIATGAQYTLTADLDKNVVKALNDWLID